MTRVSVVEDPEDVCVIDDGCGLVSLCALPPQPVKSIAQPTMKMLRMLFTPPALSETTQRVWLQAKCQFTGAAYAIYCYLNDICPLQGCGPRKASSYGLFITTSQMNYIWDVVYL